MEPVLPQVQNSVVLPIYSAEKRRVGESNPGGTPQIWEQHYVNCYPEFARNKQNNYAPPEAYVIKRPGLNTGPVVANTIASYGTGTTMHCYANMCMTALTDVYISAWFDSTASKIYIIQYRPIAGTTTKLGELTSVGAGDFVFITEILQNVGGTYPVGTLTPAVAITYMKNDRTVGAGYYATSAAGVFGVASLTAIASASFPSNLGTPKIVTGPIEQLNGANYVMCTNGEVFGSGAGASLTLYDITTWNTNTIVAASIFPDQGVGVKRYKNMLLAFGQNSLEFFQDGGVPPPNSALERVDQAVIKIGALSPKYITNIDDTVFWVAYGADGQLGVWKLDQFTPIKVSTPKIDYGLATANAGAVIPSTYSLECLILNYKKHLIVHGCTTYTMQRYDGSANSLTTLSAANDTFSILNSVSTNLAAMSLDEGIWWAISMDTISLQGLYPATLQATTGKTAWKQYIFFTSGTVTSNKTLIYAFNNLGGDGSFVDLSDTTPANYVDPVTCYVQFNVTWFGTEKRKRIHKAKLICDKIGRLAADSNTYGLYIGWAKETTTLDSSSGAMAGMRAITLTAAKEALSRYYIANLGHGRSWGFLVAIKHPGNFRLHGLELDIDQATS